MTFTNFLFTSGDFQNFVYTSKSILNVIIEPVQYKVMLTSESQVPISVQFYNGIYSKYPFIGTKATMSASLNAKTILYCEGKYKQNQYNLSFQDHQGVDVYIEEPGTCATDTPVKSLVLVCGQETIAVTQPPNAVFNIHQQKKSEIALKYSLSDVWTVIHPNSSVQINNSCQIVGYKLCQDANCSVDSTSTTFSIAGTHLIVDISKSITSETIYLTPITSQQVIFPQLIIIKICGNEIISLEVSNTLIISELPSQNLKVVKNVANWFSTNDEKCPINKYSIKADNGSALNAHKEVSLVDQTLNIHRNIAYQVEFDLQAETVGGVMKGRRVKIDIVLICGAETLNLAQPQNTIFEIFQEKRSETALIYPLTNIWTVANSNSYINENNRCPIVSFKLCLDVDCSYVTSSSIFSISGNELTVDISSPITRETIYLTPVTSGGVTDPKPVVIKVCGNEIISTVKVGVLQEFLQEPVNGAFQYDLVALFESSDQLCPIEEYSLTAEDGNALPIYVADSLGIKIEDKTLYIDKSKPLDTSFNVKAKSQGGSQIALKFQVHVKEKNTGPKFLKPVDKTLKIKLIKGVDGKIEDDSIVYYKSTIVIDDQDDPIIITFDLGNGRKFLKAKQNRDNSFSLQANRATMPHESASITVKINLADQRGEKGLQSQIQVVIDYDDEIWLEAEENKEQALEAGVFDYVEKEFEKCAEDDDDCQKATETSEGTQKVAQEGDLTDESDSSELQKQQVDEKSIQSDSKISTSDDQTTLSDGQFTNQQNQTVNSSALSTAKDESSSIKSNKAKLKVQRKKKTLASRQNVLKDNTLSKELRSKLANFWNNIDQEEQENENQFIEQQQEEQIPLEVKIQKFNFEGQVTIRSNQPIKKVFNLKRELLEESLVPIDSQELALLIFDIQLIREDESVKAEILNLKIDEWNEQEIKTKIEFEDSLKVSSGSIKDQLKLKIKESARIYFQTSDGYDSNQLNDWMEIKIPIQLPQGISQVKVQNVAESGKNGLLVIVIIQIISQLFMKRSMANILPFYFQLQLVYSMTTISINFPPTVIITFENLSSLIKFQFLNPNYYLNMIEPGLTIPKLFLTQQQRFNNSTRSIIPDFLWVLFAVLALSIVFVVSIAFISLFGFKQKIRTLLIKNIKKQISAFQWNQTIQILRTNNIFQCMSAVAVILAGQEFIKAWIICSVFFCLPFVFGSFLYFNYDKLGTKEFKSKYQNLYQDVSTKRGRRTTMSIPFSLLQNWSVILSTVVANQDQSIQGVLILLIFVFSVIAVGKMRAHNFRLRRWLEMFNVFTTLVICYNMVCMTNFNLSEVQIFNSGYSFIGLFLFQALMNLFFILKLQSDAYARRRQSIKQKKMLQTQYLLLKEAQMKKEKEQRRIKRMTSEWNRKWSITGQSSVSTVSEESTPSESSSEDKNEMQPRTQRDKQVHIKHNEKANKERKVSKDMKDKKDNREMSIQKKSAREELKPSHDKKDKKEIKKAQSALDLQAVIKSNEKANQDNKKKKKNKVQKDKKDRNPKNDKDYKKVRQEQKDKNDKSGEEENKKEKIKPQQTTHKKGPLKSADKDKNKRYASEKGDKYQGQVEKSLPHGKGIMRYADGSVYVGNWRNGIKIGSGWWKKTNGDIFSGKFKYDLPHGQVEYRSGDDNETYKGEMRKGLKCGLGVLKRVQNYEYNVEFKHDKIHGKGVQKLGSLYFYDGQFKNDKKHGQGHEKVEGGTIEYIGTFKNDIRQGKGKLLNRTNGFVFKGEFENGVIVEKPIFYKEAVKNPSISKLIENFKKSQKRFNK